MPEPMTIQDHPWSMTLSLQKLHVELVSAFVCLESRAAGILSPVVFSKGFFSFFSSSCLFSFYLDSKNYLSSIFFYILLLLFLLFLHLESDLFRSLQICLRPLDITNYAGHFSHTADVNAHNIQRRLWGNDTISLMAQNGQHAMVNDQS